MNKMRKLGSNRGSPPRIANANRWTIDSRHIPWPVGYRAMFRVGHFPCGGFALTPTPQWRTSSGLTLGAGCVLISLSIAASCTLCASIVGAAGPAPANGTEVLQKLARKWASQDKQISSASIRFRLFRQGGYLKPCTPAEIAGKLQGVDFVKDPEAMRRFVSSIYPFGEIPPNVHITRRPHPWSVMEFKMAGEKRREEDLDSIDVQLATADVKVETNQVNNQIHIYAPRGSVRGIVDIADFRIDPRFHSSMSVRSVEGPIAVISTSPGRFGHSEFRVDIESGALLELAFYDPRGQVTQQLWQGGWTLFPGDVRLPRWRIAAHYNPAGKLQMLTMSFVEKATLNKPVPDAAFYVAAVKGVTVFDHRVPGRLASFRLRDDTTDIVGAADNPLYKGDFTAP
jgi:hypothetical protein